MTITNGYCTLDELKARLLDMRTYTAATISFAASTKTITDTAHGLRQFLENDIIQISGSASNDGYYTITTGNVAGSIVVSEALTDEAAGASVTIVQAADPVDDTVLEQCVEAASRWIDNECGRVFYSETATRTYTPPYSDIVFIDDLISVTTLKTDSDGDRVYEDTLAATDYDLLPENARYSYTWIETTPGGDYSFPAGVRKGLQIAGVWGFATPPPEIKNACLLEAAFIFTAKNSPQGVIGNSEMGELRMARAHDTRAYELLKPWRRIDGV